MFLGNHLFKRVPKIIHFNLSYHSQQVSYEREKNNRQYATYREGEADMVMVNALTVQWEEVYYVNICSDYPM